MNFTQAITTGFQKYVTFSGRATRSEYWYWTLFTFIASVVAILVNSTLFPFSGLSPVNTLVSLGLFLPGLAVSVRRLHDLEFGRMVAPAGLYRNRNSHPDYLVLRARNRRSEQIWTRPAGRYRRRVGLAKARAVPPGTSS